MQSKAAGTLAGRDSTIVAGSGTVELVVDARPAAASGGGTAAASAARDDNVDASAADAPPPAKRSRRLPSDEELAALQQALGNSFKDSWLLRQALIHPSFGEWNMAWLTWIGDAVLGMMVSDQLFRCLPPDSTTEALHDRRKALVRREACAKAAAGLGLDEAMVVGRGYEGKQPTMHMLAEGWEALWGAVFVDSGSYNTTFAAYSALYPMAGAPD